MFQFPSGRLVSCRKTNSKNGSQRGKRENCCEIRSSIDGENVQRWIYFERVKQHRILTREKCSRIWFQTTSRLSRRQSEWSFLIFWTLLRVCHISSVTMSQVTANHGFLIKTPRRNVKVKVRSGTLKTW